MKALRYENDELHVADIAKPLADGEALVRVTLSGICNTDLEIARGYAGFQGTLGHEFVGVIEEISGSSSRAAKLPTPGRRVVGEINAGCGNCPLCQSGDTRHCPHRTVLGIVGRDGAHAEFLKLPLVNLLPVPDEIADVQAVFTEPLAAACGILERATIPNDRQVAVIGDGKLGLLCAQVFATSGATVTLIGKHESKLRIAKERSIETMLSENAARRAGEFELVIEASGSPQGFELALKLLRPRGTLILKSTFHGATEIDAARIVVDEISVVGSRCGRFAPAMELLRTGRIEVEGLISEEFPLGRGVEAMARASEPGVMKVLLRP